MSADLMVFDKSKAPTEPLEFLKWFYKKSEWDSDRDYFDTKGTSKLLTDFFMELVKEYPAMNGEYAPTEEELENDPELESKLIDYTIDDDLIYMGIAYSVSEDAFERIEALAYKYGLGYYDMFEVHLDKDTVIRIPQISREKLNEPEKQNKKGFFSKLFGRK